MINIIRIMHAADTGRYHPIWYSLRPLPGPATPRKSVRYKSRGHHTEGFEDLEAARVAAAELESAIEARGEFVAHEDYPLLEFTGAGTGTLLFSVDDDPAKRVNA